MLELFENKEYIKLNKKVNKELAMPYIPKEFESFLLETKDKLESQLEIRNIKNSHFSFDEVFDLLKSPDRKINKDEVLEFLSIFNLNNKIEEIQELLNLDNIYISFIYKLKIIFLLKNMNINKSFTLTDDLGRIHKINVKKVAPLNENPDFILIKKRITEILFKYPVMLKYSLNLLESLFINKILIDYSVKIEKTSLYICLLSAKELGQESLLENLIKRYEVNLDSKEVKNGIKEVLSLIYYGYGKK